MGGLSVSRKASGAELVQIKAVAPIIDLSNGIIKRVEADGTVTLLFSLLSFTLEELVDIALSTDTDLPTGLFKKGVIATPTFQIDAFTFDVDSPLSALQELATLAGLELGVRRDGDNGFFVDLVESVGALDTYGALPATFIVDTHLAESVPTTNLGTAALYSIQRGPGGTDATAVFKIDLNFLKGLPVKIVGAKIVFTINGVGSGVSFAVQLIPLRSAASGPFTGQPREIVQLEATWTIHETGRSWASGGARASNDDRDDAGVGAFEDTIADTSVAGATFEFTGDSVNAKDFAEFLQDVVDGVDAFYKDGFARFVLDANASGQSGKFAQVHSRRATTESLRPRLELTIAQDKPRFLFQKNLIGIDRNTDPEDLVNRIYAVGAGGEDQGIRLTLGKARWTVATTPSATTFTVVETAIFEDDHLVGNFIDDLVTVPPLPAAFGIVSTTESTQLVETSGAHGLTPGDVIAFRLDADATELAFVESPVSQTNFGLIHGVQLENDLPLVDNLVANPAFKEFTGGSPDSWSALGASALSQETDPIHTTIGGSAVKVITTAVIGDGIISDAFAISPDDPQIFFSASVILFVEAGGGGVEVFLEHSVDGRFPLEGDDEGAYTTKTGAFIEIRIEGVEFSAGTMRIGIVNKEASVTTFYVDSAQFVNLAQVPEFFDGRASILLWQRALDKLAIKNVPKIIHKLPSALDLTGIDPIEFPYDEVIVGGNVLVDDERLKIEDLTTRVLKLRRELLTSSVLRMELSNSEEDLIRQLTNRQRRTRKIQPPGERRATFQAVTATVAGNGEVLLAVTGGNRMRSFRFATQLDTPIDYDTVADTGAISNTIDGSFISTGFFLELGEIALVRVVAFPFATAGGRPGATEVRAVSRTLPGSQRVRLESTVDLSLPIAVSSGSLIAPWDFEVYDPANMHPGQGFDELIDRGAIGGVYIGVVCLAYPAPGGGATSDHRQGGWRLTASSNLAAGVEYAKAGAFKLLSAQLDFQVNDPSQFRNDRVRLHNETGADTTVLGQDAGPPALPNSFWQIHLIPVATGAQNRCHLLVSTSQSVASGADLALAFDGTASGLEVADVGDMHDLVINDSRITIQEAKPHLFLLRSVWTGKTSGAASFRRTTLREAGATALAIVEFIPTIVADANERQSQHVAFFVMDPSVGDFFEHVVRQDTGVSQVVETDAGGLATGAALETGFQVMQIGGANTPRASVSLTANLSVANAVDTIITWTSEDFDVGSMFAGPTDSDFVTPVNGQYFIIVNVAWASSAAGIRRVRLIRVSDTTIIAEQEITAPGGVFGEPLVVLCPSASGEAYRVEVRQESGGALDIDSARAYFQIMRIPD